MVSKTVGANSAAVADYAFALMLALARNVVEIDTRCREKDWRKVTTSDVSGKTLSLIGLGSIGRQMVSALKAFQCASKPMTCCGMNGIPPTKAFCKPISMRFAGNATSSVFICRCSPIHAASLTRRA